MLLSISSRSYKHLNNLQIFNRPTNAFKCSWPYTLAALKPFLRGLSEEFIMQLLFIKKLYFHFKDIKAFPSHLFLACISKTDCLIFSLCTDCIFNANQFINYSKAKMKPVFIHIDEGSFIPWSQVSDTWRSLRRRAVEGKEIFKNGLVPNIVILIRSIQLLYLSSFAINYK